MHEIGAGNARHALRPAAFARCLATRGGNVSRTSRMARRSVCSGSGRGHLEEDPQPAVLRDELAQLFPIALRGVEPEIRRLAAGIEQSAKRRLARDTARIHSCYRDLLSQIGKRIARRAADAETAEKERSGAAATQLDRAAKLEDLVRKYSLKIRIQPADVLVVHLPVREIPARLASTSPTTSSNILADAMDTDW